MAPPLNQSYSSGSKNYNLSVLESQKPPYVMVNLPSGTLTHESNLIAHFKPFLVERVSQVPVEPESVGSIKKSQDKFVEPQAMKEPARS